MRLFVAVYPSTEAVDSLRAALPGDHRLRWAPPEQWHVTLAFLGEVDGQRLPDLQARLGRAAGRGRPMTLALHGAGAFPKPVRRGHTLWVGLRGDVEPLERLAARARAAARRVGIDVADRTFRPHLTVARARERGVDLTGAVAALAAYDGPPFTVADLLLVRSVLGDGPARHEPLASWPLGGRAERPDGYQA